MDPDATLTWLLRLCRSLDDAIELGTALDGEQVYTLVGLVTELDAHLAAGGRAPRAWVRALAPRERERDPGLLVIDPVRAPSNDAPPTHARPLAPGAHSLPRTRRGRVAATQLSLPFATTRAG